MTFYLFFLKAKEQAVPLPDFKVMLSSRASQPLHVCWPYKHWPPHCWFGFLGSVISTGFVTSSGRREFSCSTSYPNWPATFACKFHLTKCIWVTYRRSIARSSKNSFDFGKSGQWLLTFVTSDSEVVNHRPFSINVKLFCAHNVLVSNVW